MENEHTNENPQTEAVNEDINKKARRKDSKQATVLKQLSNQSLYPIQERIGIYMIAILSTVGLGLIIYTGVMALINTVVPDEQPIVEARPELEMDLGGIDDILDEVADVLENSDDESDETDFQQDEADLHIYVDDEEPTYGVITGVNVDFMSLPGSGSRFGFLQADDEVTILQLVYNTYWTHIETQIDFGTGPATVQGFIYRHLIDPVSD